MLADWKVEYRAEPALVAQALADFIIQQLEEALQQRGEARLVLAGGTTFLSAYALLAAQPARLDWTKVQLFFGDERLVPPSDSRSNIGSIRAHWWGDWPAVSMPALHPMVGEQGEARTAHYQALLSRLSQPLFDLVLLGMGADGHTASIFPQDLTHIAGAREFCVEVPARGNPLVGRLTLTPIALASARHTVIALTDPAKAPVMRAVLAGEKETPLALVAGQAGQLTWFTTENVK